MSQPQKRFSIFRFLVSASLQFGLLLLAIRLVAPGFWASQAATGAGAFLLVCLAGNLFLTFFEWGFHRYLLHQVVIGRLSRLAATHRNHHSLTPIRLERVKGSPNRVVLNRYPIVEQEQYEDSAFPFYALLVFWLIFSPLLIVAQCLIPGAPVVLGGLTAITWSTVSYEVLHAVGHWPYDRWEHMTEHPTFGPVWKKLYGFHHYHHANTGRNMAISGFILGFPLADFVLGTYHQPRELLLEGRTATALDFAAPALPRFVQRLDGWARKRESNVGRREARTDTPAA